MALNLKEIQAKLLAQQAQKEQRGKGTYTTDNSGYPFWNNPVGSTAAIRFLPDGDTTNDYFWVDRLIIKIPFNSVKGNLDSKPVTVQVPCLDMWKPGSCPISAEIRPWWKDSQLEDLARKYWRKKTHLFQGFVTTNPNLEDVVPENPIRRFVINPSIFDIIKAILLRPDIENIPTDFDNGREFYLTRTEKAGYANYTSSYWGMKERPLNETERSAIDTFGLHNLSQFLPKKPDDDAVKAIMELFHASVNEEPYDLERWGQYFKPNGMRNDNNNVAETTDVSSTPKNTIPVTKPVSASTIMSKIAAKTTQVVDEDDDTPWEKPNVVVEAKAPEVKVKQTPEQILAAIRKRQQG